MLPLDLHVLSLSLAFILSQGQTLHCYFCFVIILLCDSLDVLVLIIGSTYIRVLFRSGRLLKRSILPRIRSHALISCCQEIVACTTQFVIYQASQRSRYLAPPPAILPLKSRTRS